MSAVLSFPTAGQDEIISYNPATGEELGRAANASSDDVLIAVEKSRAAFETWRATSFKERARLMMKAREVILAEMDDIARLISEEVGKPFGEAISTEIAPVLDLMH